MIVYMTQNSKTHWNGERLFPKVSLKKWGENFDKNMLETKKLREGY